MAIPPIPKSVTNDLTRLDFTDAVTQHEKLWDTYGHDISAFSVNLAVGILILALTFWAASWGSKFARRAIGRVHSHGGTPDVTLQIFIGSLTRYVIIIVGMMVVLQQLGVKTTSVLAVLSGLLLGVGLALQGTLSNVAAGVMLLLFRPYRVGDLVEVSGRLGTVRSLDLMVTELTTVDNLVVTAPNGKVWGDFIVNYTRPQTRRVDVTFHVPPTKSLAEVLAVLKAQITADKRIAKDPEPSYEANALNELFAEGIVRVWVKASDYGAVKTDIVLGVQKLVLPPPPEKGPPEEKPAPKLKGAPPKA